MRPEDFSPGNSDERSAGRHVAERASMRPEDFSPGNGGGRISTRYLPRRRFNEAGGFLPRKLRAYRTTIEPMTPELQ